jgi:hypothetical protein
MQNADRKPHQKRASLKTEGEKRGQCYDRSRLSFEGNGNFSFCDSVLVLLYYQCRSLHNCPFLFLAISKSIQIAALQFYCQ